MEFVQIVYKVICEDDTSMLAKTFDRVTSPTNQITRHVHLNLRGLRSHSTVVLSMYLITYGSEFVKTIAKSDKTFTGYSKFCQLVLQMRKINMKISILFIFFPLLLLSLSSLTTQQVLGVHELTNDELSGPKHASRTSFQRPLFTYGNGLGHTKRSYTKLLVFLPYGVTHERR